MKKFILALAVIALLDVAQACAMISRVQKAIESDKYTNTFADLEKAIDDKARQALITKRSLPFTLADYKAWKETQEAKKPLQIVSGPTVDELLAEARNATDEQEIHKLKALAASKNASPVQLREFEDLAIELAKKKAGAVGLRGFEVTAHIGATVSGLVDQKKLAEAREYVAKWRKFLEDIKAKVGLPADVNPYEAWVRDEYDAEKARGTEDAKKFLQEFHTFLDRQNQNILTSIKHDLEQRAIAAPNNTASKAILEQFEKMHPDIDISDVKDRVLKYLQMK